MTAKPHEERPVRLLLLEDSSSDAELMETELKRQGLSYVSRRVETQEAFLEALESFEPDLVLSDYRLPAFDGASALALVRERCPGLPFIFVSGTLGEELAVETIKGGATDYVLKNRLERLAVAIPRALNEVREHAERLKAEEALRKSEERLLQAQKMEAVGRLAGGIAHDFNNILTSILGSSEFLLEALPQGHPARPDADEVRLGAMRAAALTRQLLLFSRKQVRELKPVALNAVVAGVEKMLRRVIGEDIRLAVRLDPRAGCVRSDPGLLEQVLVNLAVNARDAMPEGGSLEIETACVELAETLDTGPFSARPGRYVSVAVRDSGCGMDAQVLSRLFEPFFTTKEAGKGTGLGLSTVADIVEQTGGAVQVDSAPGKGSLLRVLLPQIKAPAPEETSEPPESRHGSETVLLVEDDEQVRLVARRVLAERGYRVIEARQGEEGLRLAREHAGEIHLAVSDVVMPGMGGENFMRELSRLRPEAKGLFLSGYADSPVLQKLVLAGRANFLEKPFAPEALARKVRELLDG